MAKTVCRRNFFDKKDPKSPVKLLGIFIFTQEMRVITVNTDQVGDHSNRPSKSLVQSRDGNRELWWCRIMKELECSHRPTFRENYLKPAMEGGWIERTMLNLHAVPRSAIV